MQFKSLGRAARRWLTSPARPAISPLTHGLQQTSSILPVASPEHGSTLAGHSPGRIGIQLVVDDNDLGMRRQTRLGTPAGIFVRPSSDHTSKGNVEQFIAAL
jgi:hypothetical protein